MGLEDSKLLPGVQIPHLNSPVGPARVEKRSVYGQGIDRFGVALIAAKRGNLVDVAAHRFLIVILSMDVTAVSLPPQLDRPVPAARDEHLLIRIDKHRGALGNQHRVHPAEMRIFTHRVGVHLKRGLRAGNQGPAILDAAGRRGAASRCCLGERVEEAVFPHVRVHGRVRFSAALGV